MSGTFVYFSWDVMEPISYMMLFSNFTLGFFFYNIIKRDMELGTIKEILSNKFARRMYRKKGLDIDKLEKLTEEIIQLKQVMNQSVY
jgi:hypothetical protein